LRGNGAHRRRLIHVEDCAAWADYVEARIEERHAEPPRLDSHRGRRLAMRPAAACLLHVDDELWLEDRGRPVSGVIVSAGETRLEVLLPSTT
jgi:hypothetical protein